MKTTIDIADPLLNEARRLAARDGTTLRSLVEQGLRHVLGEAQKPPAFRLRRATFCGNGMRAEFQNEPWAHVRDAAYTGRGG